MIWFLVSFTILLLVQTGLECGPTGSSIRALAILLLRRLNGSHETLSKIGITGQLKSVECMDSIETPQLNGLQLGLKRFKV